MPKESIEEFVKYYQTLKGYEKGEAQPFLEHLFKAFGYEGAHEAGAFYEAQLKREKTTKFRDLLWPGKVLVEMKSRGEDLGNHVHQAREYWNNSFDDEKTEYVILCNFDEFWIYNWYHQDPPLDKVKTIDLPQRWRSLAFFSKEKINPQFQNDVVAVTKEASRAVIGVYRSLINREIKRSVAQRFILQCLICLFAEDTGLFPINGFFLDLINDCKNGQSTFDLFTLLFNNMNSKEKSSGGKFKDIDYFNGGIFHIIEAIELNEKELEDLEIAAKHDWSKVEPSIFGNIFEYSMDDDEQHDTGAHYTYEKDIMLIVRPTIIEPWLKKINNAKTLKSLLDIHQEMSEIKILDPACGSGNFLYIAYRELKKLELELFRKIVRDYKSIEREYLYSNISCKQFFGIDINSFAVELAKITLSFGKKLAADAFNEFLNTEQLGLGFEEKTLPFDDLDSNIISADALFTEWPDADIIISNPPYMGCKRMIKAFGNDYVTKIENKFPNHSRMSDYVTYWFEITSNIRKKNLRVGFVATNTIRQNESRISSLDLINNNNGHIYNSISSMKWSGDAKVYVSIINWIQNPEKEPEKYFLDNCQVNIIRSNLTSSIDLSKIKKIEDDRPIPVVGVTPNGKGFFITPEEKDQYIKLDKKNNEVIKKFITGDNINSKHDFDSNKYLIDFVNWPLEKAMLYKEPLKRIKELVKPDRDLNRRKAYREKWWLFQEPQMRMRDEISKLEKYIAISRITKYINFVFLNNDFLPSDKVVIIPTDSYSFFGILQSKIHEIWVRNFTSSLGATFQYTHTTMYSTFPFPDNIDNNIGMIAEKLYKTRLQISHEYKVGLTELYNIMLDGGFRDLFSLHEELDKEVLKAYNIPLKLYESEAQILDILYDMNVNHE